MLSQSHNARSALLLLLAQVYALCCFSIQGADAFVSPHSHGSSSSSPSFAKKITRSPSAFARSMIIDGREGRVGHGINSNSTSFASSSSTTELQYSYSTDDEVKTPPVPVKKIKLPKRVVVKVPDEEHAVEEAQQEAESAIAEEEDLGANFHPHRQELLSRLSMLPKVAHAKGSYLYLEDGREILDCIAQYGAVPFGHNNQQINDAVIEYLSSNQPGFIQPFMPESSKELSRKLCELTSRGCDDTYEFVVFSNSGAETVEAAVKLARTRTKRSKILSATNSFHGKTFSALSATGSTRYANEHTVCNTNFQKVPMNDIAALEEALSSKDYAAFLVEPVQGEGGMIPATQEYLTAAQEICKKTKTLLVLDEIQTGLGRTGAMFAKDLYDVHPDIILLSKALGGGTYPIGAMVTKRATYSKEFDMKHSSTFASGGLGATVALKTLELLETTDILENVRQQSQVIENGLARIKDKFPDILSFDGTGLMWALDFKEPEADKVGCNFSNYFWRTALSYIICGFLLNEKQILCMPFLGKLSSVRFEPSLTIEEHQVMKFLDAVEDICTILKNQRHDILMSFIIQRSIEGADINERFVQTYLNNPKQPAIKEGEKRRTFAFLSHTLSVDDTIKQLPAAVKHYWDYEDLKKASEWTLAIGPLDPSPTVINEITMTSKTGETVTGLLLSAPVTPYDMMKMSKLDKQDLMDQYLQAAKGYDLDHIVGLGAFTSVITKAGTQYVDTDEQLFTTGSSFTALASAESLKEHASKSGDMGSMGVMVIGGKGTVGRLALMELMQYFGTVNIVGNPKSGVEAMEDVVGDCIQELIASGFDQSCQSSSVLAKMATLLKKSEMNPLPEGGRALVQHLRDLADEHNLRLPISITTDATTAVDNTNYVLTATSEGKPFLSSDTFLPGTVIFDLARPFDFEANPETNIEVYEGGLVNLPEMTKWGSSNICHYPAGVNLACLSETIALAMEGVEKSYSLGSCIPFTEAKEVYNICIKHGFSHLSYGNPGLEDDTGEVPAPYHIYGDASERLSTADLVLKMRDINSNGPMKR